MIYLLYRAGAGWHRPQPGTQSRLYALSYANGGPAFEIALTHGVDRIEALGANAVGTDGKDLHFTSLRLARLPVAAARYVRRDASQGATRRHGFQYKPDTEYGGLVGLPIKSLFRERVAAGPRFAPPVFRTGYFTV